MAFFKFRKAADAPATPAPPPQSIEAMRRRAKHRLLGASVLVVAGVIGFPLLFDKQPRPIAVDTPIDIPDRNKVPPLVMPAAPGSSVLVPAVLAPSVPISQPVATAESGSETPVHKTHDVIKNVASQASKPVSLEASAAPVSVLAASAQALPDGKPKPSAAQPGRYILQVGAFAEAKRAQEVRLKLERAGLKTYTHVAETPDGKRIRVRVGPFSDKAEAEKTAVKIKKLNLPAALLTL